MKHFTAGIVLLALLAPAVYARPDAAVSAEVIAVIDGDTLLLKPVDARQDEPRLYKLRLADIDAPEKDQPCGAAAKQALVNMVLHRQVRVVTVATDHFGRRIGWLRLSQTGQDEIDINELLVQRGWAWASTHYRASLLRAAEQDARQAKRGLWVDTQPVPPWVWRKLTASHAITPTSANILFPSPLHD